MGSTLRADRSGGVLPQYKKGALLEYLRSFGLFGLWQLWQSSGPGIRGGATGACGGRISHQ